MSGLAKINLSKLIGCPDTQMLFYFHTTREGGGGGRMECVYKLGLGNEERPGDKRKALNRRKAS